MLILFSVVHNSFQIQIAHIFPVHYADMQSGSSSNRSLKEYWENDLNHMMRMKN